MADINVVVRDVIGFGGNDFTVCAPFVVSDGVIISESLGKNDSCKAIDENINVGSGTNNTNNSNCVEKNDMLIVGDNVIDETSDALVTVNEEIGLYDNGVYDDAVLELISPISLTCLNKTPIRFEVDCLSRIGVVIYPSDINWYSNVDGIIKTGNDFVYDGLSLNEHIITITINGHTKQLSFGLDVLMTSELSRPENLDKV